MITWTIMKWVVVVLMVPATVLLTVMFSTTAYNMKHEGDGFNQAVNRAVIMCVILFLVGFMLLLVCGCSTMSGPPVKMPPTGKPFTETTWAEIDD